MFVLHSILRMVSSVLCDWRVPLFTRDNYALPIEAYHRLNITRLVAQEELINAEAIRATESLKSNLPSSLAAQVAPSYKQLETLRYMADGYYADGCFLGVGHYLANATNNVDAEFISCSDTTIKKQENILKSLLKQNGAYQNVYNRSLKTINQCAGKFRNYNDKRKLETCLSASKSNYFKHAHKLHKDELTHSPSFDYFKASVIECVKQSVAALHQNIEEFHEKSVKCAEITGERDIIDYAEKLNTMPEYADTLMKQINSSMDKANQLQTESEVFLQRQYEAIASACARRRLISGNHSYYSDGVRSILKVPYEYLNSTVENYPEETQCTSEAKASLDKIVESETTYSMQCLEDKETYTLGNVKVLENNLDTLTATLLNASPAAILLCISKGYILDRDTIFECYKLAYNNFLVERFKRSHLIRKSLEVLSAKENDTFHEKFPCGEITRKNAELMAEEAIYSLNRCLHIPYEVITINSDEIQDSSETSSYSSLNVTIH